MLKAIHYTQRSQSAQLGSCIHRRLHGSLQDSLLCVPTETKLPEQAQVVIAGSGLIGNSIAYHLCVEYGWKDVVVIDKGHIADGTSKHGSGMLGLFRPSHERQIVQDCITLYRKLQRQGFDIGLKECGSLNLAQTRDRMLSLRRRANRYKPTGLECQVMSPRELLEIHPYLYTEDLQGGVWIPEDAVVHPKKVSEALAYRAFGAGARFVRNCKVKKIHTKSVADDIGIGAKSNNNIRVSAVETDIGTIKCEYFVNCAGIWAREVGLLCEPKVKIPLCTAEHFFLTFKDVPQLETKDLPCVRDYDNQIYMRSWNNSFLIGAFEKTARPFKLASNPEQISEDQWIHWSPNISSATKRVPILKQAQYDFLMNTPDGFTPDGKWILGESAEVGNFYICAGMNGNSLQAAGGVGNVIAKWMTNDHPPGNMLHFEAQRFTSLHNNPRFLLERTDEVVGKHYELGYPYKNEFMNGRRVRTSPIFSELEARGGVFGERMGWERPLYFDPYGTTTCDGKTPARGTFGRPEFLDLLEDEYFVCRERVGIIDMSSFSKYSIKGEEKSVLSYLQTLCSNDVDIPIGGIISTGMLNEAGGYENDCLLVRKAKDNYFMVCPTQQQTRIMEWMGNHLPEDNSINLRDVTSMYTVLSLAGPKAKALMQELTQTDMSMHPFTFQYLNMAYASSVIVLAVTNTGEPGYSLYIPSDHALNLYEKIMSIGRDYGIKNVGHLAMRFLRIEKFIPFWGEELTSETTPIEVNRAFKVKFDKKFFIGKEALAEQKASGITKRLVQFQLQNFDPDNELWPWVGESIYRNGEFVGSVTNSAYGFTLQKMICLGFVQHPSTINGQKMKLNNSWLTNKNAKWTIDVGGKRYPVSVHLHPPTIPAHESSHSQSHSPSKKAKKNTATDLDLLQKINQK